MGVRTASSSASVHQPGVRGLRGRRGSASCQAPSRPVRHAGSSKLSAHLGRPLQQSPLGHPAGFTRCRKDSRGVRLSKISARAASEDQEERKKVVKEHSGFVNEELLLFFFKIDLGTRLQRALNLDRYEDAQALRAKIEEVDSAITRHEAQKTGGSKNVQDRVTDRTAVGLQLRSELQRAIEEERYQDAATIRDKLSEVNMDSLADAVSAAAAQSKSYTYRLGLRVVHREDKWAGLICGMEPMCCEANDWQKTAGVDNGQLADGMQQPFYQVLVDTEGLGAYDVAYVPQERLLPFEDIAEEEVKVREIEHPYTYLLFFGMDQKGNYIPTRHLREKYNAERHEALSVAEEDDEDEDDDGNSGNVDKKNGDNSGGGSNLLD